MKTLQWIADVVIWVGNVTKTVTKFISDNPFPSRPNIPSKDKSKKTEQDVETDSQEAEEVQSK